MAWSPQARAAAIAARKARAHGSSKKLAVTRHPMIAMNGHHGVRGGKTQPASMHGHKGLKTAAKVGATAATTVALAYAAAQASQTNTYKKNKLKAKNIRTKKRVGYKRVQISKAEYRHIKAADAHMGTSDTPAFKIGIDRMVKKPVYKKQFRTKQNRKDVFHSINNIYHNKPKTTVASRHQMILKKYGGR